MKHYSESDWQTYKQHLTNKSEMEIMENHLLNCDQCLDLFLNLTNELDSAKADTIIPPDFSRATMAFIHHSQIPQRKNVRSRDKIKRLLSYYVVASAVTLILVSSGFFTKVVNDVSLISAGSTIKTERPDNIIFTWPNRLMETSSSWTQLLPKESKNIRRLYGD